MLLWAAAGVASAAPCSGAAVGNASTDDVTLGSVSSDACVISAVNPQQGPDGNTSGFEAEFAGSGSDKWSLLAKVDSSGGISPNASTVDGVTFVLGFKEINGVSGTWSLSTNVDAVFDLVFAMHASDHSGAFLFDGVQTKATTAGSWNIEWLNNGSNVPSYSNLTLFVRDVGQRLTPEAVPVPEPATYLLLLGGFVAAAVTRRRKA